MLYSPNSASFVLGTLLNNTNLLTCGKYYFRDKGKDFEEQFHNIIFRTIQKLAKQGCSLVEAKDIYEFLKTVPSALTIFENSNGLEYIEHIKELAKEETFDYYYTKLRKYSLLRMAQENNINIDEIYDVNGNIDEQEKNIETLEINTIIEFLDEKMYEIKNEFLKSQDNTTRKKAGENSKKFFKTFKNQDFYGVNFESNYLTSLWGAFRTGQVYMRSGDTSSGKSRHIVGDLAKIGLKEIYNSKKQEWVKNPYYCGDATLYIGTEMELQSEVEPLFVAYATNIESSVITEGKTTDEEDLLIEKALDVIEDGNLFLIDMPEFNLVKLEEEIKYYKSKYGIKFVGFDYVALTNQLVSEFISERGKSVGTRGDEILLSFMEKIKQMAKKYDVGIITASQTNADIKDYMKRDYSVLRAGKSMSDKLTGGSISMPITQQEMKLVEGYVLQYNQGKIKNRIEPNFVETVYKSRFSKYPKECKIFSYYNLGTMRQVDMFVTDKNFEPISVEKMKIYLNT